jgi:hypothetical protein
MTGLTDWTLVFVKFPMGRYIGSYRNVVSNASCVMRISRSHCETYLWRRVTTGPPVQGLQFGASSSTHRKDWWESIYEVGIEQESEMIHG